LIDRDLILAKAGSVKKHLGRVAEKSQIDLSTFLGDLDRQESILFNLQMAIQNCIDMAAHIVSEEGLGVPGSTNEMFYLLEENGYLHSATTEQMVRAVGFKNLIVHEYGRIDLKQVFEIAGQDSKDLNDFLIAIFKKVGISG
jgi:uncharacterized protein YutE (UPF0331/DUF86 family)